MTKLEKQYNKAISDYIKAFEQMYDVEVDEIGERGGVVEFSDIYLNFEDLKRCVDQNLKFDYPYHYFYFIFETKLVKLNFKTYVKVRKDFEFTAGFGYDEKDFEIYLLKFLIPK